MTGWISMHEMRLRLMVISHCDNVITVCDNSRKVIIFNRNATGDQVGSEYASRNLF